MKNIILIIGCLFFTWSLNVIWICVTDDFDTSMRRFLAITVFISIVGVLIAVGLYGIIESIQTQTTWMKETDEIDTVGED